MLAKVQERWVQNCTGKTKRPLRANGATIAEMPVMPLCRGRHWTTWERIEKIECLESTGRRSNCSVWTIFLQIGRPFGLFRSGARARTNTHHHTTTTTVTAPPRGPRFGSTQCVGGSTRPALPHDSDSRIRCSTQAARCSYYYSRNARNARVRARVFRKYSTGANPFETPATQTMHTDTLANAHRQFTSARPHTGCHGVCEHSRCRRCYY